LVIHPVVDSSYPELRGIHESGCDIGNADRPHIVVSPSRASEPSLPKRFDQLPLKRPTGINHADPQNGVLLDFDDGGLHPGFDCSQASFRGQRRRLVAQSGRGAVDPNAAGIKDMTAGERVEQVLTSLDVCVRVTLAALLLGRRRGEVKDRICGVATERIRVENVAETTGYAPSSRTRAALAELRANAVTWHLRAKSSLTTAAPMNPAAPVTNAFMC
jgi:hypothetical protein